MCDYDTSCSNLGIQPPPLISPLAASKKLGSQLCNKNVLNKNDVEAKLWSNSCRSSFLCPRSCKTGICSSEKQKRCSQICQDLVPSSLERVRCRQTSQCGTFIRKVDARCPSSGQNGNSLAESRCPHSCFSGMVFYKEEPFRCHDSSELRAARCPFSDQIGTAFPDLICHQSCQTDVVPCAEEGVIYQPSSQCRATSPKTVAKCPYQDPTRNCTPELRCHQSCQTGLDSYVEEGFRCHQSSQCVLANPAMISRCSFSGQTDTDIHEARCHQSCQTVPFSQPVCTVPPCVSRPLCVTKLYAWPPMFCGSREDVATAKALEDRDRGTRADQTTELDERIESVLAACRATSSRARQIFDHCL